MVDPIILSERLRDPDVTSRLIPRIKTLMKGLRHVKFMHVCGSHEHTITYYALRSLLPENLELVSGPGCPVCVCAVSDIYDAIKLARMGKTVCTFGDMLKDRTPYGSLEDERSKGADVRIVYSPLDAVNIARDNPEKDVVFFGVGFETTAAPICSLMFEKIPENFSILTSLKRTSPAVESLLQQGKISLEGVIAPGHVSTIVGANDWSNIPNKFMIPTIVSGFEPADVLLSTLYLLEQVKNGRHDLMIEYTRLVKPDGNPRAKEILARGFEIRETYWRGMGRVPGSGYFIRPEFKPLDARARFDITSEENTDGEMPKGCMCHKIVIGEAYPSDCALFRAGVCRPDSPAGPCMVSREGTCYIWFRYGGGNQPAVSRKKVKV